MTGGFSLSRALQRDCVAFDAFLEAMRDQDLSLKVRESNPKRWMTPYRARI